MLSSQDAEAELQPAVDQQAQIDLLMRQVTSYMQRQIRSTASLVVGRLVRTATVQYPGKDALAIFISNPAKKRRLQHWLNKAGSAEPPEEFAEHFDELYSARCGNTCCSLVCFPQSFQSDFLELLAKREHPTDKSLATLVKETRQEPFYSTVQSQGSCSLECAVLDHFATLSSMFK